MRPDPALEGNFQRTYRGETCHRGAVLGATRRGPAGQHCRERSRHL